jgi:ABC-type branched-subunit amino acid transport system substrate-binding protein
VKKRSFLSIVVAFIGLAVMTSCAGPGAAKRPKYPMKLTPEIRTSYQQADSLYQGGQLNAADKAFAQFIDQYEYNELTDQARFKRGEIRFKRGRYSQALPFYRQVTEGLYNPSITPYAHLRAATVLYRLKRYGETIDEVSKIRREVAPAEVRLKADSLGMLAAREVGWPGKRIVRFALFLVDDYIDLGGVAPQGRQNYIVAQKDAIGFVRYWVGDVTITEADMATLPAKSYAKKPSGGYFMYKEALVKHRMGDFKASTSRLKKFTRSYPKNEYYAAAKTLLEETAARAGEAKFKVGVILPLSGQYSRYGQSVLKGIECALGIYAPCEGPTSIQMVTRDSTGSSSVAATAVVELADEGVDAIIGPLLSVTASAAATKAQQLGIPLITLSQREGIASIGDFIFRNSVTSRSQVDALVGYTSGRKGMKKFMIFYPNNKKGMEFQRLFAQAVRDAGGKVVASKSYDPRSQDLTSQVRDVQFAGRSTIDLTQPGTVTYDAVFLPGSAWAAAYIAPMMHMMGMEKVQLLGTMRWNDTSLIERGGKYLEGAIFVRAFDKDSRNTKVRKFVDSFKQAYRYDPTLLEGLGYDAMKIIVETSGQGIHKRETIKNGLANLSNFPGVTGKISFDNRGDAKRSMQVVKIKGGKAQPID